MIISSRTPEGEPNHCPFCQRDVCLEPSTPPGDAPCPHCGCLLWFAVSPPARLPERPYVRNVGGRYMDAQGNILDPVTLEVDFAATFASVVAPAHAGEERRVRPLRSWERILAWIWRRLPARGADA